MTDNNFDESSEEEEIENEDSTDSSSDENEDGDTHSDDGDGNSHDDPDKEKPFHEHPRWKEREEEHKRRFNDMETRHQEDMKKLREEFGSAPRKEAEPAAKTKVPSWFGGSQEQWDEYQADQEAAFQQRLDDHDKGKQSAAETAKKAEDDAVREATEYMKTEIEAIQSDKKLNPTGEKVDPAKLLKIVMDEQLIDTQGRWNYKAGYKLLKGTTTAAPKVDENKQQERRKLAGASNSEGRGESQAPSFKTSADFKKNRPW